MKNIIVLYHKNCMDGNGAYYSAYKKFGNIAEYIAVNDRDNPPSYVTEHTSKNDTELYILDFCYSKEVLAVLEKDFKKLVVLDHHVSAKSEIESVHNHVYGTEKSGAYLAFEYFHPDLEVPLLIKYISDGDTWTHAMPEYKKVLNYIHSPTTKDILIHLDEVSEKLNNNFNYVVSIGSMLQDARDARVRDLVDTKQKINFAGYEVYAVNGSREMRSEVGHELANLTGTFGVYFYFSEGKLRVSLRSVKDFDVSVVAAKLGGGGHKNASAVDMPFEMQSMFDFSNI